MGKKRNGYNVWAGRSEGKAPLENLDVNGKILKWLSQKEDGEKRVWTGFIWLSTGTMFGSWEHGNDHSGSTKCM
jgi:hypothetical protein